jgi:hypothetical protein
MIDRDVSFTHPNRESMSGSSFKADDNSDSGIACSLRPENAKRKSRR